MSPQLTHRLGKDTLLACTLQMFPLEPKGEREKVSRKETTKTLIEIHSKVWPGLSSCPGNVRHK